MTQPVQKIALIEEAAQKWYPENPEEKPIEYLGYGARSIKNYIFQWHGKEYVMNICGGFQNYCSCWHQYTTKSFCCSECGISKFCSNTRTMENMVVELKKEGVKVIDLSKYE